MAEEYLTLTEFVPGTKAKAQEVNSNFSVLKDAVVKRAATNGDSTQVFSVANATATYHAVNKGQMDALSETLNGEIKKTGMKFCVKLGNTTGGKGDLFSYEGLKITPKIGGTYKNLVIADYLGAQSTIVSSDSISLSGQSDGTYNIFIKPTGVIYVLRNNIYKLPARPSLVEGDIWLDTSSVPFKCTKLESGVQNEFLDVPVGKVLLSNGAISSIETFQFNQNGFEINRQTLGYRWPDYSSGVSKAMGTTYTAETDGWLLVETMLYQGGNVYCALNGISLMLSHENYSQDSSGSLATLALSKGDVYSLSSTGNVSFFKMTFFPAK